MHFTGKDKPRSFLLTDINENDLSNVHCDIQHTTSQDRLQTFRQIGSWDEQKQNVIQRTQVAWSAMHKEEVVRKQNVQKKQRCTVCHRYGHLSKHHNQYKHFLDKSVKQRENDQKMAVCAMYRGCEIWFEKWGDTVMPGLWYCKHKLMQELFVEQVGVKPTLREICRVCAADITTVGVEWHWWEKYNSGDIAHGCHDMPVGPSDARCAKYWHLPYLTPWGPDALSELDFHAAQMLCMASCLGKVRDRHRSHPEANTDSNSSGRHCLQCKCNLCAILSKADRREGYTILRQQGEATEQGRFYESFPLPMDAVNHHAACHNRTNRQIYMKLQSSRYRKLNKLRHQNHARTDMAR